MRGKSSCRKHNIHSRQPSVQYDCNLKALLQEGISHPELYRNLGNCSRRYSLFQQNIITAKYPVCSFDVMFSAKTLLSCFTLTLPFSHIYRWFVIQLNSDTNWLPVVGNKTVGYSAQSYVDQKNEFRNSNCSVSVNIRILQ